MTTLSIIRIALLTIVASVIGALIGTLIRPVVGFLVLGAMVGATIGFCYAYAGARPFVRKSWLFLTFRGTIGRLGFFVWVLALAIITAGIEYTQEGLVFDVEFSNFKFAFYYYLSGAFRIPSVFSNANFTYWFIMLSCLWLLMCAFLARAHALNFGGLGKSAVVIGTILFGPNVSAWIVFLCLFCWITPEDKAMPASASGEDSATQIQAEIEKKTERREEGRSNGSEND